MTGTPPSNLAATPPARDASVIIQRLRQNLSAVVQAQDTAIDSLLTALLAGAHVLLEDVPGTGKTTLAKALAASIQADFKRIQFTPDLLPSDIIGVSIFDQANQAFRFRRGPLFTEILLADEINRASPRTQSALLEAMAEHQVSIDGDQLAMNDGFFVIATQNPIEFHGTYPLPEAQMDRFGLRFKLGYVSAQQEVEILTAQQLAEPLTQLQPVANTADIAQLRETTRAIPISNELKRYIVDIVAATRQHGDIDLGASPRGAIMLMKCSQAMTLLRDETFVTPDTIATLAAPVLAHRLSLTNDARFAGRTAEQLVQAILASLPVPA